MESGQTGVGNMQSSVVATSAVCIRNVLELRDPCAISRRDAFQKGQILLCFIC